MPKLQANSGLMQIVIPGVRSNGCWRGRLHVSTRMLQSKIPAVDTLLEMEKGRKCES